ncbi:hypothetical protein P8H26_00330 [Pseudochrobactrum sp. sp1633]|uniref:hypothetical protein n=1 Tax=Pseudochrobactrum sp. sp1633 TaxID=3036706 RepID=UPI0025A5833A|nr:hypothetical protein [Pseudochrobactrum sp. sp1633]MDM8343841.1 hypothetical protein [Pseudochrobactrum sp. sp1633]HWD11767.1 hypothetical protein [Pseudochrobactrum sp.]
MRTSTGSAKRFVLLAMFAPLVAACTTTSNTTPAPTTAAAQAPVPVASQMPSFPQFVRSNVAPELANPCITAAANRYYIPERVITAVDSRPGGGGNTDVILKVDSRDARCTISANGTVRSVVDTSPMSADQRAANEAAANAPAVAPAKAAPAKKASAKQKKAS